jgi:hypothetical protein
MLSIPKHFLVFGSCALALLAFHSARAAEVESETVTLTAEHRTMISEAGVEILQDIREARAAIADGNEGVARRRTARAQSLVEQLRWGSPTARTQDRVKAALRNLRQTGSLDAERDLVPIYAELDEVILTNEGEVRAYLGKAEKAGKQGGVDEVDRLLVEVSAEVGYSEIDLPVNELDRALTRALFDLGRGNTASADAELRSAQDQIRIVVAHASIDWRAGALSEVSAGPR